MLDSSYLQMHVTPKGLGTFEELFFPPPLIFCIISALHIVGV